MPYTAAARTSHHCSQSEPPLCQALPCTAAGVSLAPTATSTPVPPPTVTCSSLPRDSASQPWFVPVEPIVTGPGSSLVPLREMVLAHPGLQLLALWTRLQRHLLHWTLLLFQRRLRLLSPNSGDTRPGWDLGPLLLCIQDHAGGPRLPSRPGHQARVSHRGLGLSCRLLQLIRVHRPSYPHIRGSCVRCLAAIRFQGTSIFVPGTSMESHTTTYQCSPFSILTKTPQNDTATRALQFSYTHVTLDNLAC